MIANILLFTGCCMLYIPNANFLVMTVAGGLIYLAGTLDGSNSN